MYVVALPLRDYYDEEIWWRVFPPDEDEMMDNKQDKHAILDTAIDEFRKSAHLMLDAVGQADLGRMRYTVSSIDATYLDAVEQAQGLMDILIGQVKSVILSPSIIDALAERKMHRTITVEELVIRYNLSVLKGLYLDGTWIPVRLSTDPT